MSQAFMESAFPLPCHTEVGKIREAINSSLYGENSNPLVSEWSDEAIIYMRSDWSYVRQRLSDEGIKLSASEEGDLIDFSSEYASLVDEEIDMAELAAIRKEGES